MKLAPALLESWMREYYFQVEIDIGSSGVEDFSFAELRQMLPGLEADDLDRVVFRDSQTLGGSELRQAIAQRWGNADPQRVMATHGSSEANYLIMNTLLEPGDEVVVLDPGYPQLYLVAQAVGCRLRAWKLRFENDFVPDLDELRRLLGSRTRMVVVNFPHNPTGASLSPSEQKELIEAVARVGAYLVWDNAFQEVTYESPPLPDPTSYYERAVAMGTLSKCYGLPGLRVGWCLAAPELLTRLLRLRDYVTLHLSPLVELIARRAIEGGDRLLAMRLEQARTNLQVVAAWAGDQEGRIEWVAPKGGVSAFPRLTSVADTERLCRDLARKHKVLLVPGKCFNHDQHVRLGFGGSPQALRQGLERLTQVLPTVEAGGAPRTRGAETAVPGRV